MRHVTHENFLRMMYPTANMDIARQINRQVDNPKGFSMMPTRSKSKTKKESQSNYTPFDIPGLIKYPHRKKHDLLTMGLIGSQYGYEGIKAMAAHALGDIVRDNIVTRHGRRHADLFEAAFNYFMDGVPKTPKRKQNNNFYEW